MKKKRKKKREKEQREHARFKGLSRGDTLGCCRLSVSKQTDKLKKKKVGLGLIQARADFTESSGRLSGFFFATLLLAYKSWRAILLLY